VIRVLYEDADCLVAIKPQGMPTQPDPTGDEDMLTLLTRQLGAPLYLIHRLDRTTGGLVLFAKGRESAACLSAAIQTKEIQKRYLAVCEGELAPEGVLCDLLFHDKRRRMSFVVDRARAGVKEARLTYRTLGVRTDGAAVRRLLEVTLLTGRFHQIRAQLASRGCPLLGDGKYGSRHKCPLALHAVSLTFPVRRGCKTVLCTPDAHGAWEEFSEEIEKYAASQYKYNGRPTL